MTRPASSAGWRSHRKVGPLLKDNGCSVGGIANDDGDHFFCIPKSPGASANLADLFKQAINQLIGGTKLIQLPTES